MSADGRWQPYPAYKDSGVDWLGEIPRHWEMKRLKYAAAMNSDVLSESTDPDHVLQYLDISNVDSTGSILDIQEMRFENAPSRARRQVQDGDTIISTVRTYLRAIAHIDRPPDNLIVSTGFAVLRPTPELEPKYLWRLVQSSRFVDAVVAHSVGVGYPAIAPTRLADLSVWVPPLEEQRAIATFLDCETAKIDALVAKQERLIALLQEKRAALISHAVTKGLDPDVEVKDSGIPWLGEIPGHWEVRRLKFAANVQSGVAKGRDLEGRKIINPPYLRVANVQNGYVDLSDVATIAIAEDEIDRYSLKAGDVLMTEGGDFDKLGRGTVWEAQIEPCVHQNHIFAIRPYCGVSSYWISTITQTDYARHYFILRSKQSTNLASISSTNLMELPVVLPPDSEQEAILIHLGHETAKLDALIAKAQEMIERLQEYRTALISAAVTGKIDVRCNALPKCVAPAPSLIGEHHARQKT